MIYISVVVLDVLLSVYIITMISSFAYGIATWNSIWAALGMSMFIVLIFIGMTSSAHAQSEHYVGFAEVHDGDTLKIKGQSFRLAGIDAPELNEPYGIASRDMLITMIREGLVICIPTGARSYKRLVAVCGTQYYDDLGAELIHRGLALDCEHYSHGKYRELEPKDVRKKLTPKGYCK